MFFIQFQCSRILIGTFTLLANKAKCERGEKDLCSTAKRTMATVGKWSLSHRHTQKQVNHSYMLSKIALFQTRLGNLWTNVKMNNTTDKKCKAKRGKKTKNAKERKQVSIRGLKEEICKTIKSSADTYHGQLVIESVIGINDARPLLSPDSCVAPDDHDWPITATKQGVIGTGSIYHFSHQSVISRRSKFLVATIGEERGHTRNKEWIELFEDQSNYVAALLWCVCTNYRSHIFGITFSWQCGSETRLYWMVIIIWAA